MDESSRTLRCIAVLAGVVLAGAAVYCATPDSQAARPKAKAPAKPAAKPVKPKSNLDLWLNEDAEASPDKKARDLDGGRNPFSRILAVGRPDALPGVVELSDGRILAGGLYTTVEKPWLVFVEKESRWRRVPFITALSIVAVVVSEKMELRWRWKAMGEPEKVYTGKKYPTRRFLWKFRLLDGSYMTGAVKGQPLWVQYGPKRHGPFVLHERSRGKDGQSLKDLVYVKRVIVSRRMMDEVLKAQAKAKAAAKKKGK